MNFTFSHKLQTRSAARDTVTRWKNAGLEVVFTNGCFDLLHYGHLATLAQARALGDKLVVGLNSSASIRRLKGETRPINDETSRAYLLAAMEVVDLVVIFEEDTPLELLQALRPDVLVKGGDYDPASVVGADLVLDGGGAVHCVPFQEGFSTTRLEQKIISNKK